MTDVLPEITRQPPAQPVVPVPPPGAPGVKTRLGELRVRLGDIKASTTKEDSPGGLPSAVSDGDGGDSLGEFRLRLTKFRSKQEEDHRNKAAKQRVAGLAAGPGGDLALRRDVLQYELDQVVALAERRRVDLPPPASYEQLQGELKVCRGELLDLRSVAKELDATRAHLARQQSDNSAHAAENMALKTELRGGKLELEEMERKLSKLHGDLVAMKGSFGTYQKEMQAKMGGIERQRDRAQEAEDRLASQHHQGRKEVEKLQGLLDEARGKSHTLERQLADLRVNGQKAEGELSSKVAQLEGELQREQKRAQDALQKADALALGKAEKEKEAEALRAQIAALQGEITAAKQDFALEKERLQGEVARSSSATSSAEEQIKALEQHKAEVSSERQQLVAEKATLEAGKTAMQGEMAKLSAELEEHRGHVAARDEQIAALQQAAQEDSRKHGDAVIKLESEKALLEQSKAEVEDSKQELQAELKQVQLSLELEQARMSEQGDEASSQLAAKAAEVAALEGQVEERGRELEGVRAQLGDLQAQLDAALAAHATLAQAKDEVEASKSAAEAEVERLTAELAGVKESDEFVRVELEGHLQAAEEKSQRLEGELAAAQEQVAALQGDLASKGEAGAALSSQAEQLKDNMVKLESAKALQEEQLAHLEEQVQQAQAALQQAQLSLELEGARATEAEAQAAAQEAARGELAQQVEAAQGEAAEAAAREAKLGALLDEALAREQEREGELGAALAEIAALKQQQEALAAATFQSTQHSASAKNELAARNDALHEALGTTMEQRSMLDRTNLKLMSYELRTLDDTEKHVQMPMDVVVAETSLAQALEQPPAAGAEPEMLKMGRILLEQYADLHSLEAQRQDIIDKAALEEEKMEKNIDAAAAQLADQSDPMRRVQLEDDLARKKETLEQLKARTSEWVDAQKQRGVGAEAPKEEAGAPKARMRGMSMVRSIMNNARRGSMMPGQMPAMEQAAPEDDDVPSTPHVAISDDEIRRHLAAIQGGDVEAAEAAAEALGEASKPKSDSGVRERLVSAGALPILLDKLKAADGQVPVRVLKGVAGVAAHIARTPDYRAAIAEDPAVIPRLVGMLKTYENVTDAHMAALVEAVDAALINLCNQNDDTRAVANGLGCMPLVIRQLGDGNIVMLSSEITRNATVLLRSLVYHADVNKSREIVANFPREAVGPLVRLLAARQGSEFGPTAERTASVAINVAWVLSTLARDNAALQEECRVQGAVPVLVTLLEGPGQLDVQLASAIVSTLAYTAHGSETNAKAICKARGVGPLLKVLLDTNGPGKSLATRQSAAKALRALTSLLYTEEQKRSVQSLEQTLRSCTPEQKAECWARISRRARQQIFEMEKTNRVSSR